MSDALPRAIEVVGGRVALASALGVTPQAIFLWLKKGRVPVERALAIETLTGGKVTRRDLRPDIFGALIHQDIVGQAAEDAA